MEKKLNHYNHTIYASYLGYITQAIVNNYMPLLFLIFQRTFELSLDKIALLVTFNFGMQLLVDIMAAKYAERIGYRKCIVFAHACAAIGLIGIAVFPYLLPNAYIGILLAVACYAVGGGLIEVLISPVVEACPTEKKEAVMSLLHSFYCWGHVFVVICTTIFFQLVGTDHWRILACIWAIIPIFNLFYFMKVPIMTLTEEGEGLSIRELAKNGIFWLFLFFMICAGASEQGMSQWASAFAESGLNVSKTIGDLAGPCMFAILMGTSRTLYAKFSDKISLDQFMIGSAILCIISYLVASLSAYPVIALIGCGLCGLSVGIMWPGTFSKAAKVVPNGGTTMFAMFALAGDFGCMSGPGLVGFVSEWFGQNLKMGILFGVLFPIGLLGGLIFARKRK